jgi:quercetin dioxygenase-like cupin family protein
MITPITLALLLPLPQATDVALDNAWVRVTRDAAPCAAARAATCGHRVIVALGDTELRVGGVARRLARGDIAVFGPGEAHDVPSGGPFFEVALKPDHPPVQTPPERILPDKNVVKRDDDVFFIFEERLEPGETRARHSHNQRVVMQLNRTRLEQWPDGQPVIVRDIEPDRVGFNDPVIHVVKNVGDLPLRGIVIELKRR